MKSESQILVRMKELNELASKFYRDGDWQNGNYYDAQAGILRWALKDEEDQKYVDRDSGKSQTGG